jgi:hypothetical protein
MSRRSGWKGRPAAPEPRGTWLSLALSTVSLFLVVSPNLAVAINQRWLVSSAAYVISFVVGIVAAAVACRARATRALGAVAGVLWATLLSPWIVLGLSSLNVPLPRNVQTVAFLWPSKVFFGPTLFYVSPERAVLPEAWAGIITLVFWMVVAVGFARVAPRRGHVGVTLGFAALTVIGTVWLVGALVPLWGWKLMVS